MNVTTALLCVVAGVVLAEIVRAPQAASPATTAPARIRA
jgi:hypothetical protein